MSEDGTFILCPSCREPVVPETPGVESLWRYVPVEAMGDTAPQYVREFQYFFHSRCPKPRLGAEWREA